jgi:hypothetical protein
MLIVVPELGHRDTHEEYRRGCLVNTLTRVVDAWYLRSVDALVPRKTSLAGRVGKADVEEQAHVCVFHVIESLS